MSGRSKYLVASAVAAYAMTFVTCSGDAPLTDYTNPAYAPAHQLNPTPIMGIRGDVRVLKTSFVG